MFWGLGFGEIEALLAANAPGPGLGSTDLRVPNSQRVLGTVRGDTSPNRNSNR